MSAPRARATTSSGHPVTPKAPESLRTAVFALAANLGTALVKLAAAIFTGSSAMWAEGFHAFADSGNELLLVVGQRSSVRPPDDQHPLGHGRAAYFWALIASLGVFVIGALLSVHQGVQELVHPEPTAWFSIAYATLALSFCLDGVSFIQARRQLKVEARALNRSFLEHLDLSSDPVARAVFAEDAAALAGNLIAFVGIALHQVTHSPVPDGVAAILIGILLAIVAFQLAARNGDVLMGGQVSAGLRMTIRRAIAAQPGIIDVTELLVTFIGPRRAWVVARVAIDPAIDGAHVEALVRTTEEVLQRESPFITRVDIVPRGR